MRKISLIMILLCFHLTNHASTYVDQETLTEKIINGNQGTIFTGKVLSIIPPKYHPDTAFKNGIVRKAWYDRYGILTLQLVKLYFGKLDTNIITFETETNHLQIGKTYLIYRGGIRYLESTKVNSDLQIIEKFYDIFRLKKTGKFTFYNELNTCVSEGECKKGVPINIWNHYRSNGTLKASYDFNCRLEIQYYDNGYVSYTKNKFPKLTISRLFSNKSNGLMLNVISEELLDSSHWLETHTEFFENGNVKNIYKKVEVKSNHGYSSEGKIGKFTECYNNGQQRLIGEYWKNNVRIGKWIWYNKNGSFKTEYDYTDGTQQQMEEYKNIANYNLIGQYVNGKKAGIWTWYDRNGLIIAELDYQHGWEKQEEFRFENWKQRISVFGQYIEGIRSGLWVWNNFEKNVITEYDYKTGNVSQIEYKEKYINDKIKVIGQCENDKPVGIWLWFDQEGDIVLVNDYKEGLLYR